VASANALQNPFIPRSLPPAPAVPASGVRDSLARAFGSSKAIAKKNFWEACQLFIAGSYAAADTAFAQVNVQQLPDPAAVQLRIALYRSFCAAVAENYAVAQQWVAPICQQQPANEAAWALLGRLYYVQGQFDLAIDALRRAVHIGQAQSDLEAATREQAAALLRNGRWDEASRLLEPLQTRQPVVAAWLASIHIHKAGQHYRVGRYGSALSECDQAEQGGYRSPWSSSIRGLTHLALLQQATAQRNVPQARTHLTAARQLLPMPNQRLDQLAAGLDHWIYSLATLRLWAKDYASASRLYQGIITSPNAPPSTRALLALALSWNGATREARQTLVNAPTAGARSPLETYLLGYFARRLGLLEEAYVQLQQLYRDAPNFPRGLDVLVNTSLLLGVAVLPQDPARALDLFRFAHQTKSSPPIEFAYATTLTVVGTKAFRANHYADAESCLSEALQINNALAVARNYLALVLLSQAVEAAQAGQSGTARTFTEVCLNLWLGADWHTLENLKRMLQTGLASNVMADVQAGWVAQVLTFYANLLLQEGSLNSTDAQVVRQWALMCVNIALTVDPAPVRAHGLRGLLAYLLDRDFAQAAQQLRAAGINTPALQRILAAAAAGAGDYARAAAAYQTLVDDRTWRTPQLALQLAYYLWKINAPDKAAATLADFARHPNASPEIVMACAYFQYAAGQALQAQTLLESLPPDVLTRFSAAALVGYEAGIALLRAGKFAEAATQLARSSALNPAPQVASLTRRAQAGIEQFLAVQAVRQNQFEAALEHVAAGRRFDETRQTVPSAPAGVAQVGVALRQFRQGHTAEALVALETAAAELHSDNREAEQGMMARLAIVRAALLILGGDPGHPIDQLLEPVKTSAAESALGALLCGAQAWYETHDTTRALEIWEAGRVKAAQAPLLLRLLALAYQQAQRYVAAAEAYAAHREATGDHATNVIDRQAWCWLMADRPREALALLTSAEALTGTRAFLRGYARAKVGAWSDARDDFARSSEARAQVFAAQAACRVALNLIEQGDLVKADAALAEALRLSDPQTQPIVMQAQARLQRQQGMALLNQGQLSESVNLLQGAVEQGLTDDGTRTALAAARFGLARAPGNMPELQAAAADLAKIVPTALAARVLVETGCVLLRQAGTVAQPYRLPLLKQASAAWREALRLNEELVAAHVLLGRVAFRLWRDPRLALVHLQRAHELAPRQALDVNLGEVYLATGQVFLAKVFFFECWQVNPADQTLRQTLNTLLQREDGLLRRFARDEKPTDNGGAPVLDLDERAQLLNLVVDQLGGSLPADRLARARELRRQLKQALIDHDLAQLEQIERDLLTVVAPGLMQ
jgi:tetratricopeptide (TPR) repeat protein